MANQTETRPLMPAELAKLMGCSRPVIDAALKAGKIPHTRLGHRIFIPRAVAMALLNGEPMRRCSAYESESSCTH